MAVSAPISGRRLVDLRQLNVADFQPLLEEEVACWSRLLHWDFSASASMLTRYAGYRALDGLALLDGAEMAGYCYWVVEGRKALIGDVFVRPAWQSLLVENTLLRGALDTLSGWPDLTAQAGLPATGWVHRIEAQLMLLNMHGPQVLPQGPAPATFRRFFMIGDLEPSIRLRPIEPPPGFRYERWNPTMARDLAGLIENSYRGHIDSQINDQYRTFDGAKRFLDNITNYPGCGVLKPAASWVLIDPAGCPQGLALCTSVAPCTGHVAQICVTPALRGAGAGYELMRRAMTSLLAEGLSEASLTVTAANGRALAMYQRLGFRTVREFDAFVWESA
ncbi:MAG TPA: GNAT family N-acetyltransferase [Bryobacteraceae bacterium]|nr:GNAT family N-acetyltransferase [Bryobacteraceae bacterium]HPT27133.1 GNAT family N-acetyltransferase [Bryobacteraceae bacterium]